MSMARLSRKAKALLFLLLLIFISFHSLSHSFSIYINTAALDARGPWFLCFLSLAAFLHGEVAAACFACTDGAAAASVGAAVDGGLPDMAGGALPPDFLVAGGGDVLGCEVTVQELLPLPREGGVTAGEVIEPGQDFAPATIRTAGVAPGAAGDGGLVVMPEGTAPPDLAVGGGRHLLRREAAVLLGVPLAGDLRELAGEVVEPGQHLPPAAHGAAVAAVAAGNTGLPLMSAGTAPPDLAAAAGGDIAWGEGAVLRGMPLSGENGVACGEVVLSGKDLLAGADGTACALHTGFDLGLPLMPLLTAPPGFVMAGGGELLRRQAAILCGMPLARKGWLGGGEVIEPCAYLPPAAHGTAAAGGRAVVHGGLPMMTLRTAPMGAELTAVAGVFRRMRQIGRGLPLLQQIHSAGAAAVSRQCLLHTITPLVIKRYQQNVDSVVAAACGCSFFIPPLLVSRRQSRSGRRSRVCRCSLPLLAR